jgi:dipeptidase E
MRLLLGSGGLSTEERRRAWRDRLGDFLGDVSRVLFVPWALKDHDRYLAIMKERGFDGGRTLDSIHRARDPVRAVREAEAVYVGGGNTFRLLDRVRRAGVLRPLARRVRAGLPYVGISAGTNLACPTIRTTNDMPISWPASADALGLVPFQVNAHFTDGAYFTKVGRRYRPYGGETREVRLLEFLEENSGPILALYEGAILRVEGRSARLEGPAGARLYVRGRRPREIAPGSSVASLLRR